MFSRKRVAAGTALADGLTTEKTWLTLWKHQNRRNFAENLEPGVFWDGRLGSDFRVITSLKLKF